MVSREPVDKARDEPQCPWFIRCATLRQSEPSLGACFLLGRAAIRDRLTALMRVASLAALLHWKVNNPLLIAVAAAIGQLVDS
jgi:chromate transporter